MQGLERENFFERNFRSFGESKVISDCLTMTMKLAMLSIAVVVSTVEGLVFMQPTMSRLSRPATVGDPFEAALLESKGIPALHVATQAGDLEKMREILDGGADVNAIDKLERTALHDACEAENVAAAELLLERGADPMISECGGAYPMYIVCKNGNAAIAKLLVDNGADVQRAYLRGPDGMPLQVAKRALHDDVVQVLVDGGAKSPSYFDDGEKLQRGGVHSFWGDDDDFLDDDDDDDVPAETTSTKASESSS